jgi:hypothetical protein
MTQEEKNLLKIDLCCRLPYNVKVHAKYTELGETVELDGIVKMIDANGVVGIEVMYDTSSSFICVDIDNVKPYLFPLSSMTKEQRKEWRSLMRCDSYGILCPTIKSFDYLYKNNIDCRGLILMGLAIDATGLNIY